MYRATEWTVTVQRAIDAPDKEWLTGQEAAAWLNVPESTLAGLVEKGVVPGPRKWNQRESRWHWEAVLTISMMMKAGFLVERQEKSEKN